MFLNQSQFSALSLLTAPRQVHVHTASHNRSTGPSISLPGPRCR